MIKRLIGASILAALAFAGFPAYAASPPAALALSGESIATADTHFANPGLAGAYAISPGSRVDDQRWQHAQGGAIGSKEQIACSCEPCLKPDSRDSPSVGTGSTGLPEKAITVAKGKKKGKKGKFSDDSPDTSIASSDSSVILAAGPRKRVRQLKDETGHPGIGVAWGTDPSWITPAHVVSASKSIGYGAMLAQGSWPNGDGVQAGPGIAYGPLADKPRI